MGQHSLLFLSLFLALKIHSQSARSIQCSSALSIDISSTSLTTFPFQEEGISIQHIYLESFFQVDQEKMVNKLNSSGLIPTSQPFNEAPWNYKGNETLNQIPKEMIDWVLLCLRNASGEIIEKKACILYQNGQITTIDSNRVIIFEELSSNNSTIGLRSVVSIHHKSHLAIAFEARAGETIDPFAGSEALGRNQVKEKAGNSILYAGDFDGNGIINNLDYNLWRRNSAALKQYISVDADGNGVVNNLDINLWAINKSKIGSEFIRL